MERSSYGRVFVKRGKVRLVLREQQTHIRRRARSGSHAARSGRVRACVATAAADIAAVGPEMLPLGRGETVLIVESEQERLLRDEEELAALGYEPVGFERPADALAACRSEPGRFDVILVSHGSQNHGGLDLARAFHEIAPKQPVLLAAASSIDVSADALAEAGISEVLRWPLASAELAAALARCLRMPGSLRS